VVVPTQRDVARELRALHLRTLQDLITQSGQLMDAAAMLRLRDALLLEWLRAIAPQVDVSGLQRVAQRRQWVDQACTLALADPANPPTMRALSGHLGVSPRTLQQAFGEVLGHSPARYLRALRLNGVRRALRLAARQGLGVHDVAARWGFWHQGQFAGDYKRQFGELPSATLLARPSA
jgi:AraC family ethanolamine operon transcriptional activator